MTEPHAGSVVGVLGQQRFVNTVHARGVACSNDCTREIMEQFLVAPQKNPDTICLAGSRRVFDWRVGQGSEGYRI